MYERVSKTNYYLDIAAVVSERSTCLRRRYGAVVVNDDRIVSTGYNGAPCGRPNCCDLGYCYREANHIPHGERYEACCSVHAEANAIISASREEMKGATLYLACTDPETEEIVSGTNCCDMCQRTILNSGISKVIIRDTKQDFRVISIDDWKESYGSLFRGNKND